MCEVGLLGLKTPLPVHVIYTLYQQKFLHPSSVFCFFPRTTSALTPLHGDLYLQGQQRFFVLNGI